MFSLEGFYSIGPNYLAIFLPTMSVSSDIYIGPNYLVFIKLQYFYYISK
jgi:hypothetical protein